MVGIQSVANILGSKVVQTKPMPVSRPLSQFKFSPSAGRSTGSVVGFKNHNGDAIGRGAEQNLLNLRKGP